MHNDYSFDKLQALQQSAYYAGAAFGYEESYFEDDRKTFIQSSSAPFLVRIGFVLAIVVGVGVGKMLELSSIFQT